MWVEGHRRRALPDDLEVLNEFSLYQDSTLLLPLDACGARLYLPPPPYPFPRTTVLVPLLYLLTEEYLFCRPAHPHPVGPPLPGLTEGLLNAS